MKFLRRFEEETIDFGRTFNIDSIEFIHVDRVSSSLNFRSFIFVDFEFFFLENLKDTLRRMEYPFVRRIVRIFILGILKVFLNEDYP